MVAPFDDLRRILSQLPERDACAVKKLDGIDVGSDGAQNDGLFELKQWLASWQGVAAPAMNEAHICVLASSYAGHDVSSVQGFISAASRGGAPVNRLCVDRGIGLRVLELAPDIPYDLTAPWNQAECMAAVAFGMEATASGGHLLALSDYAPGNMLPALAVVTSVIPGCGEALKDSLSSQVMEKLDRLVEGGGVATVDPFEVLRIFGGREIAASVGAIVAARSRRIPMVVDGWSALAAMAVLEVERPGSTDHVKVASCPSSPAVRVAEKLNKKPLVGFVVAAGSGCGNAIAVALLKAASDL